MSKGYRPNYKNQPDVVTVDREPMGGTIIEAEEQCWQFPLEESDSSVGLVTVGTQVVGTIHENRILVRSGSQPLGFAPSAVVLEILQVTVERRVRLVGKVLSFLANANASTKVEIWVELCVK